jgi:N-acetylmuramoyl-L-alanine amidase
LVALIDHLQTRLSGLEKIAGHEDLDTGMIASQDRNDTMIRRKLDPGPLFPWSEVMDNVSLHRFYAENI